MSLTEVQVQQFNDDGYLLVEGGLNDADLDPVIEEYAAHIDGRARELLAAGEISQIHEDAPFERRLALLCGEYVATGRAIEARIEVHGLARMLLVRGILDCLAN